jgi:hypothetical protein
VQETIASHLNLWKKHLGHMPESVGALKEHRQLDLRGNPLTELPQVIADLPRLEKLDLRWVTALELPVWAANLEARGCAVYY